LRETLRENRRLRTALLMARLTAIKTLQGFNFAFQPSLDRSWTPSVIGGGGSSLSGHAW